MGQSLEQLRPLWAESERRLYPLATTVPEKYEQVIRLAREVANDLSGATTGSDLVAAWVNSGERVSAVAERSKLPLGDLPAGDVAGVAFSLRDNEIKAAEHQQEQQRLVEAAKDSGQVWVLLHETGNLDHGLMDPYQAIEMHVQSGIAIVSSVEPNPVQASPGSVGVNHVLTVIRMDPESGAPIDIDPGIAEIQEHDQSSDFTAARTALIGMIEGL